MINEVILSNFKCYEKEPFKLSNLTVFCGNNSAGKSTVIQALLLAFQNDFSSNLELTGDYIQPGSYDDIHNRNAENDSLEVKLITSRGHVAWGYDDLEFDSKKRIEVEEAPLPLLSRSNIRMTLHISQRNGGDQEVTTHTQLKDVQIIG
jgi:predicted ATPase